MFLFIPELRNAADDVVIDINKIVNNTIIDFKVNIFNQKLKKNYFCKLNYCLSNQLL